MREKRVNEQARVEQGKPRRRGADQETGEERHPKRGPGGLSVAGKAKERVTLVAVDLDGVVWRGSELLPGAREALNAVVCRGLDLRYVTNNSTAHRTLVSERLAALGLPAGVERVLSSGFVTGRWLRERLPGGALVMVVGEEGLVRELCEAGFDARHVEEWSKRGEFPKGEPGWRKTESPAGGPTVGPARSSGASKPVANVLPTGASHTVPGLPAAVVVGMDWSFSYASLAAAQAAVKAGALFVATNPDATFPTPSGLKPGAGALVAAVATAAEKEPILMGKPGLALAEILAAVTGAPAEATLFVGDRLETDIAMGMKAGMKTVLVLTGVTRRADLEARLEQGNGLLPDYVIESLAELPGLLDEITVP